MAVPNMMDPLEWLRQHLAELDGDLVREMLGEFAQQLMSADVSASCNAGYGERTPARTNSRNGYRSRDWTPWWDDRVGDPEAPARQLLPRVGATTAGRAGDGRGHAQCYVEGVSTRRVEDIAQAMGITSLSKSQVSDLAKSLDAKVEAFRNRPLDAGPYSYVWVDALTQNVREDGRIVKVAVVVAVGVNAAGHREVPAWT